MAQVAIVGGGAAGLSAALFTSKNELETVVFDTGETWLHMAHLFNYLGIRSIAGTEFVEIAQGQVEDRGADLKKDEHVDDISSTGNDFIITTENDDYTADYVILATGADRDLADGLGCDFDEDGTVSVSLSMETSIDGLYATGAMVREEEWQAVISAGDGAAAALNILSNEKGEHFHDFDTPDDVPDI